jgi:Co/Zn/Cd efflux system component
MAVWVTRYSSTLKYSYGYHRADAIGALATVMIIWALLVWLLVEAVKRLITPAEEINGEIMLITACLGLGCNVTNLIVLQCCFSEEDEEGKPIPLLGSIASAYKPNGGVTYGYAGSRLGSKFGSVRGGSVIAGMGSLRGTVKSGSRRPGNPKSERLLAKNGADEKPI